MEVRELAARCYGGRKLHNMFKKRKNLNIRQRRLSEEEPVVEGEAPGIISTDDSNSNLPPAGKKEKKKVKEKSEPKKQSVLSFEDELEG